jgi:peptidoglycan/LPS O-acetylase OafA/YrhL
VEKLGYRRGLDGVRGVAIIAVVAFHLVGWPRAGFLGVDLFFVLSGFLITSLLADEHQLSGGISLRAFYARRARRLLPALGALVALALALATAAAPDHLLRWLTVIAAGCLYAANFVRAFVHPDPLQSSPFGHLWSLAAEEQFYLLWPAAMLILARRPKAPLIVGAAIAGAVVYRAALTATGASWDRLYFSPDTHATGLLVGCLAALLWRSGLRLPRWSTPLSLATVVGLFFLAEQTSAWAGYGQILVEAACAWLVVAAVDGPTLLLRFGPLVWFGLISYSLYLWHHPINWLFDWSAPLVTAPMSVLAAAGSYYLVERRFRRRRRPGAEAESAEPVVEPAGRPAVARL